MIEAVLTETKDDQIPILINSLSKLLEFFRTQS
jgi:hypothetical protein